ncbi:MAG: hypothetical protein KDE25_00755, partial [Novosphingobium sp.]|nr:hypothetical protein [Novosphingobium sp.]
MATALLYIPIGTQTYGPIPGGPDVTAAIGSNQAEIIKIAANGNVTVDGSFVRDNDCLEILGLSGDYLISANVAGITLTGKAGTPSAGALIKIPAFDSDGGIKLTFNDVEAALTTADGTTFVLDGPSNQTITGTEAAVNIGGSGSGGGGGGGGTPGDTIPLTVAADNLTGTGNADVFEAIISVNQNGEQTNQLQSGDRLNGLGGFDTLDAEVQDASALNGAPRSEIILRTSDVEHLKIEAQQAGSSGDDDAIELDAEDAYGVEMITSSFSDASLIVYNVNTMGDGGPSDPNNGLDNGRPTASITLCMDHTAPENVLFCASDFEVYFDADYLIPGLPTAETTIRLQMMDIDNNFLTGQPLLTNPYDRLFVDLPGGNAGFVNPDATIVIQPASFTDTGIAAYQKLAAAIQAGIDANANLAGWTAKVGDPFSVVDPDGDPGGNALIQGWEIEITDPTGTVLTSNNFAFGASGSIPPQTDYQKEVLVDRGVETDLITSLLCVEKVGQGGDGGDFIVGSMSTYGVERFILEMKGNDAGDNGVNVDQDSSIASLQTTNNALREVILWAESDVTADIVIGNSVTDGYVPNIYNHYLVSFNEAMSYDDDYCGHLYPDGNPCDLTDNRNNALRDVQLFTAAGAQGRSALNSEVDVTLYAHLSDAFTSKYLNLIDDQANAAADNVRAEYLFSGGDDHLNMNVSKSNFAYQGAATREDFYFFASMGEGDDVVEFQIGDGYFGGYDIQPGDIVDAVEGSLEQVQGVFNDSSHWYTNHLVNMNAMIVTGGGNDFVHTWGSTAVDIQVGGGNDIVFTDNSGGGYGSITKESDYYSSDFNCCRATWVFNAQTYKSPAQVNDLLTFGHAQISNAVNVSIFIHYQDLIVQWEVGDSWTSVNGVTIDDLTINQAIKDAINNHEALSSFLVAKDGPGRTLIVESKVDGEHSVTDFGFVIGRRTVGKFPESLGGTAVDLTPLQAASTTAKEFTDYTAAQLNPLGFTTAGTAYFSSDDLDPGDGARWDSEFGWDGGKELSGVDSVNVNNNRVWGSTGSDDIALSSNAYSVEHIVIKKVETEVFASQASPDYIMNFTAAIEDAFVPAKQECQEICLTYDVDSGEFPPGDVAEQPFAVVITLDNGSGGTIVRTVNIPVNATAAQMNEAIRANLDGVSVAGGTIEAVIDDNDTPADFSDDCVTIVYPTGRDFDLASVSIVPTAPTEVQTLTVSGGPNPVATTVVVTLDGFTSGPISVAANATNAQVASAIATAIGTSGSLVKATAAGDVVTLQY